MWTRSLAAAAAALLGVPHAAAQEAAPGPDSPAWQPHRQLKVLYAGNEGGHREQAFAAFLERWFDASATIPLEDLSAETAADHDVVIVDWVSQYGNDGYPARENRLFSAPIVLGVDFTKPTIAMTYVGTQVRGNQKLDWL